MMQQTSPSLDKPLAHDVTSRSGVMEINVGGQTFSTTRETLEAAGTSFFSGLISGNFGVQRDSKGHIFIDRDPKLFRTVINYLRSQCTQLVVEDSNKGKLRAILAEAEYYQVEPLIEELNKLVEAVEAKEKQEREAHARKFDSSFTGKIRAKSFAPAQGPGGAAAPPAQGPVPDNASPPTAPNCMHSEGFAEEEENDTLVRYEPERHALLISEAAACMDADF